jgi:hypothetical protein
MRRAAASLLAASILGSAVAPSELAAAESQHYDGAFAFAYPAAAKASPSTDVAADLAVAVEWDKLRASVLASAKHVPDGELEALADKWHAARIKNRAAWGMRADGGPPRDSVRIDGKKWLRWRDRIGSVLGAQEQTMTCGGSGGRLACVVVMAPVEDREKGDQLTAMILGSFNPKKSR